MCFLLARPGYFEVDIDVGSSTLASNATHLAGGYAKNLVLDLAFALQVRGFRIRSCAIMVKDVESSFLCVFVGESAQ